jgi:hypothetical protein
VFRRATPCYPFTGSFHISFRSFFSSATSDSRSFLSESLSLKVLHQILITQLKLQRHWVSLTFLLLVSLNRMPLFVFLSKLRVMLLLIISPQSLDGRPNVLLSCPCSRSLVWCLVWQVLRVTFFKIRLEGYKNAMTNRVIFLRSSSNCSD